MLTTATLQGIIDRAARQYWYLDNTCSGISVATTYFNRVKNGSADDVVEVIENFYSTDTKLRVPESMVRTAFNPLISSLESHARNNGYSSLDDWTSGLVAEGSLVIDYGFGQVYEACRAGKTPSALSPETLITSGIRAIAF